MRTRHKYVPRIVIEITPEQRALLSKYLAYGEQRRIFQVFLKDITELLNDFGYDFVGFMLQRDISYRTLMEDYARDNRRPGPKSTVENVS